jgi:hypothetical protein
LKAQVVFVTRNRQFALKKQAKMACPAAFQLEWGLNSRQDFYAKSVFSQLNLSSALGGRPK